MSATIFFEKDGDGFEAALQGQIQSDLVQKLSSLTMAVDQLGKAEHVPWAQLVDIGCAIRSAELWLDLFYFGDHNMVRALAELRRRVDQLVSAHSERPALDRYIDEARTLLDGVVEVQSIIDKNFMSRMRFDLSERGAAKGNKRTVAPVELAKMITSEWSHDIQLLTASMLRLQAAMPRALDLGLVLRCADGDANAAAWVTDLLRLRVFDEFEGNTPSFLERKIAAMTEILVCGVDRESSIAWLRGTVRERLDQWAPYVVEVAVQAGLIESLVATPELINPTIEQRPYRVANFSWVSEQAPPSGLARIGYRIKGVQQRDAANVADFAHQACLAAATLSEAFAAIDPDGLIPV